VKLKASGLLLRTNSMIPYGLRMLIFSKSELYLNTKIDIFTQIKIEHMRIASGFLLPFSNNL